MKNKLKQLRDILEDAAEDDEERFVLTTRDRFGTHQKIVSREEYFKFIIESTIQQIDGILADLEQSK